MSDTDDVRRTGTGWRVFARIGIILALLALNYVHLNWFRFDHSFRSYSKDELLAAKLYADALPTDSAPTLFATNGRNFQTFGVWILADRGVEAFRSTQTTTYLPGLWRIDVFVLPGFLRASADERQRMLGEAEVSEVRAKAPLAIAETASGCAARKWAPFGWTDGGTVLVDPTSQNMNSEQVVRCVSAGLAFINGLPFRGDTFDFLEAPSAATSTVVLDFTMRCAFAGATDARPALKSRAGITSKPSIACVRERIDAAIDAAPPR